MGDERAIDPLNLRVSTRCVRELNLTNDETRRVFEKKNPIELRPMRSSLVSIGYPLRGEVTELKAREELPMDEALIRQALLLSCCKLPRGKGGPPLAKRRPIDPGFFEDLH